MQALNFAFKDEIQKKFKVENTNITTNKEKTTIRWKTLQVGKNASKKERFGKNILSGGCAGSLSLLFVQSIDYTRLPKI